MRRRLLDLTGRNRLLNFKPTPGRAVQFVEANLSGAFGRLSTGRSIELTALPEPRQAECTLRAGRWERPDPAPWAVAHGIPTDYEIRTEWPADKLVSLNYRDTLASRCRNLDRQARLAIEETGANMLFLVIGFLEYPAQPQSEDRFLAPLVSWPVRLQRQHGDGDQRWLIEATGEEMSDNLCLREKLRQDHDLGLPDAPDSGDGPSPLERYFALVSQKIADHPGFCLRRRVALCLLSFTNMLLFRDLEPNRWTSASGLASHPLVSGLLGGGLQNSSPLLDLSEHEIEKRPASQIPLTFDADSSQHSALADVLCEGRNLVVEGPPGTGKSQTIANLIAGAIDGGKTVLFVAEKRAALEVVRQRLEKAGLLPFVLELHSNRSSTTDVLTSLRSRIQGTFSSDRAIGDLIAKADDARSHLRDYSGELHRTLANHLGLTVHDLIWRLEKHRLRLNGREDVLTRFNIQGAAQLFEGDLRRRVEHLGRLASLWLEVGPYGPQCPFWGFFPKLIIPGDEVVIGDEFAASQSWVQGLAHHAGRLARALGEPIGLSAEQVRGQLAAMRAIEKSIQLERPLPVHLITAMLAAPDAADVLAEIGDLIDAYGQHGSSVALGLRSEELPDERSMAAARRLDQSLNSAGAESVACANLESWAALVEQHATQLESGWMEIHALSEVWGWTFTPNRDGLERATQLASQVEQFPEQVIHLQTNALTQPNAVELLEDLHRRRGAYWDAEYELARKLYLDALPQQSTLAEALTTLRQSSSMFRVFRPRYRAAAALYRGLRRKRERVRDRERMGDLEALLAMKELREKWRSAPGWELLPGEVRSDDPDLDPYLSVARWNAGMRRAFARVGAGNPVLDTPEMASALARDIRRLQRGIGAVGDALAWIGEGRLDWPPSAISESTFQSVVIWLRDLVNLAVQSAPGAAQFSAQSASIGEFVSGLNAAEARSRIRSTLAEMKPAFLGAEFRGVNTNIEVLRRTFAIGIAIKKNPELLPPIRTFLLRNPSYRALQLVMGRVLAIGEGLERILSLKAQLSSWGELEPGSWAGYAASDDIAAFATGMLERLQRVHGRQTELHRWAEYFEVWRIAQAQGLTKLVEACQAAAIVPDLWIDAYQFCTYRAIIRGAYEAAPVLSQPTSPAQDAASFCEADREVIKRRGAAVAYRRARSATLRAGQVGARVADRTEMALLNHVLGQQRPRVRVRDLISRAGHSIRELKPCFMMSPQSVAQYLPRKQLFDLVVMDEASQLRPEEALGAIARGGQIVVVGDPKQLPPTSFFNRIIADETEGFAASDAESILDVCAGVLPTRRLRWHYRSQHQSLIAFSNRHFYEGGLVVLPSPYKQSAGLGVRAVYLADAIYEAQRNQREAARVVELVIDHAMNRPGESLGIITLNSQQCQLIEDLLEKALIGNPSLLGYRKQWEQKGERMIVKNLENMQGDERDAIIISTTFGKPPGATAVRQNFGPISRSTGWRRLNVLFTRARKSILLVTSLRPEDIVTDAETPAGTRAFRDYLAFARTGIVETAAETERGADSDFEAAVGEVLRRRGFEITRQLGVAGYRIDIAVDHPDFPGAYLAAVECDGATYHSARSVRDRDRIRQEILESLGWKGRFWRVWSTDWFRNPAAEADRLIGFLEELRRTWRPEHLTQEAWIEEGVDLPPAGMAGEPPPTEEDEPEIEVRAGDTVRYANLAAPEEVITVQIAQDHWDLGAGGIRRSAPLAQCLLGAVCGDEVSLRVPGERAKQLRVIEIVRPAP